MLRHEPVGAMVCAGGGRDGETAAERTHDLGRPNRLLSGRYWQAQVAPAASALAHGALPIFQTLLEPDAVITDRRRQSCKDIVARILR